MGLIVLIVLMCVALRFYTSLGWSAWSALFASFGTIIAAGFLFNLLFFVIVGFLGRRSKGE